MNDTIFVLDSNKCPPPAKISLKISVNSLFKKFCLSLGKEVQIWRVSNLMKTHFRILLKLFQNKLWLVSSKAWVGKKGWALRRMLGWGSVYSPLFWCQWHSRSWRPAGRAAEVQSVPSPWVAMTEWCQWCRLRSARSWSGEREWGEWGDRVMWREREPCRSWRLGWGWALSPEDSQHGDPGWGQRALHPGRLPAGLWPGRGAGQPAGPAELAGPGLLARVAETRAATSAAAAPADPTACPSTAGCPWLCRTWSARQLARQPPATSHHVAWPHKCQDSQSWGGRRTCPGRGTLVLQKGGRQTMDRLWRLRFIEDWDPVSAYLANAMAKPEPAPRKASPKPQPLLRPFCRRKL